MKKFSNFSKFLEIFPNFGKIFQVLENVFFQIRAFCEADLQSRAPSGGRIDDGSVRVSSLCSCMADLFKRAGASMGSPGHVYYDTGHVYNDAGHVYDDAGACILMRGMCVY